MTEPWAFATSRGWLKWFLTCTCWVKSAISASRLRRIWTNQAIQNLEIQSSSSWDSANKFLNLLEHCLNWKLLYKKYGRFSCVLLKIDRKYSINSLPKFNLQKLANNTINVGSLENVYCTTTKPLAHTESMH